MVSTIHKEELLSLILNSLAFVLPLFWDRIAEAVHSIA